MKKEKYKYVICQPSSVSIGKNCTRCLESAQGLGPQVVLNMASATVLPIQSSWPANNISLLNQFFLLNAY